MSRPRMRLPAASAERRLRRFPLGTRCGLRYAVTLGVSPRRLLVSIWFDLGVLGNSADGLLAGQMADLVDLSAPSRGRSGRWRISRTKLPSS